MLEEKDFLDAAKEEKIGDKCESQSLGLDDSVEEMTNGELVGIGLGSCEEATNSMSNQSIVQSVVHNVDEVELGTCEEATNSASNQSVVHDVDEEEQPHRHVRLPVILPDGSQRIVEAHCTICLTEIEAAEKVVWSGLECRHAFHLDCMLPWLAKGKKRCPICRHWFVPPDKIDDQKAAVDFERGRTATVDTDVMEISERSSTTLDIEEQTSSQDEEPPHCQDDEVKQEKDATTQQADIEQGSGN
jgi:hypothetical protein